MNFELTTSTFQNASQWHAWRLGLDLAEYVEVLPAGMEPENAEAFQR